MSPDSISLRLRFGLATMLVGGIVMTIYLLTSSISQGRLEVLLGGALLSLWGVWIYRRARLQLERPKSGRFRLLQRRRGGKDEG